MKLTKHAAMTLWRSHSTPIWIKRDAVDEPVNFSGADSMQGVYIKILMGMITGSESAPKDLGWTDLNASLFALRGTVMIWK